MAGMADDGRETAIVAGRREQFSVGRRGVRHRQVGPPRHGPLRGRDRRRLQRPRRSVLGRRIPGRHRRSRSARRDSAGTWMSSESSSTGSDMVARVDAASSSISPRLIGRPTGPSGPTTWAERATEPISPGLRPLGTSILPDQSWLLVGTIERLYAHDAHLPAEHLAQSSV